MLSNLATAEMESENFDEAERLFARVLRRNPKLARAVNNRAKLRLRMGAELRDVFPEFLRALELAESTDEFVRHTINLCQCAAFGSDDGAPELFSTINARITTLIEERFPPHIRASQHAFFRKFIEAYLEMSRYRKAIAERDWGTAERQLRVAQAAFANAGLHNFARGVENTFADFLLCKRVFSLLEDIARDQSLGPAAARDRASTLLMDVRSKRPEMSASSHRRLYEVLNAFLTVFVRELEYLAKPDAWYQPADEEAQALVWLTGASFRSMGDELLGICAFAAKRCQDLSTRAGQLASTAGLEKVAADEWSKLALYVHGCVLEFRDVDAALARAALGWKEDSLGRVRADIQEFRAFVERQAHKDVFVAGKPQENIARALLQARLAGRSYREVPVRGGQSDILVFERNGERILVEAKIWRGADYHDQGKRELAEYIEGENDDGKLLAAFYVVFDPTKSARAIAHEGLSVTTTRVGGMTIETIIIRISPGAPSQMPAS